MLTKIWRYILTKRLEKQERARDAREAACSPHDWINYDTGTSDKYGRRSITYPKRICRKCRKYEDRPAIRHTED